MTGVDGMKREANAHPLRSKSTALFVSAAVGLLSATGCGMHRASDTHVEDPGTHVISYPGATSVTWSDGKTQRICTLPTTAVPRYHHGPGKFVGFKRGGSVDAVLFRLCEARGNGDLTQQQYLDAVDEVLATMGKPPMGHHPMMDAGCPHCRGMGKGMGMGRGKGMGPGGWGPPGNCPHCRQHMPGNVVDESTPDPEPPPAPAPAAPVPKKK